MTTQAGIITRNHQRAVRFFWGLLIGASTVSLIGNVAHAVLPFIPRVVVHVGAAAVPPVVLLAAVHGIALAVRAGASGRAYFWAVSAVALIGIGAFAVSFLALRDLMQTIGYGPAVAWVFPAIVDTAVAVSTLMLVALGDKPARRTRAATTSVTTQTSATRGSARGAESLVASVSSMAGTKASQARSVLRTASRQADSTQRLQDAVQHKAASVDTEFVSALIASGVTTQPEETVVAVLAATENGTSINAAAKASGINYRTAQRIVQAAAEHRQLLAVG